VTRADRTKVSTLVNGNALPNVIIGLGIANLDVGVHKELSVNERMLMQFRFEGFNVLNRANLTAPAANYLLNTPTGGEIAQPRDMRRIQLALMIVF
jgi:hypothetical protein